MSETEPADRDLPEPNDNEIAYFDRADEIAETLDVDSGWAYVYGDEQPYTDLNGVELIRFRDWVRAELVAYQELHCRIGQHWTEVRNLIGVSEWLDERLEGGCQADESDE